MIQCVSPAGDFCGEGAVWNPQENALYWADINRFLVHRIVPGSRDTCTWFFNEPVTSVNLTTDPNQLLLVLGSKVGLWSPSSDSYNGTVFQLPTAPNMRFNDARVDPRGALWAGTMRNNVGPEGEDLNVPFSDAVLYRIDPSGDVSEWKHKIGISNTLAWSPDRKAFYFGDTIANAIYRFTYDEQTGSIADEAPYIVGYGKGVPDGSAMDSQGYLWNARPGAGCLIRIAPDGHVDRIISLPVSHPTTCTFGGPNLTTLYITSGRSRDRLCGSVFAMETNTCGLPEGRFLV